MPLSELAEPSRDSESAYAVLASHGFFLPDQIPKLLQQAKDENLMNLEKILFTVSDAMDHIDDDGNYPIHRACQLNDPSLLQHCLNAGAEVNQPDVGAADNYGQTALHRACCKDKNEVVTLLLEKGAKPEVPDNSGATAVHNAAQCHGTFNLKKLLRAGAPVSPKDKLGSTPLLRAALFGSSKNIELLIENGADVNASNTAGSTALHLAAGLNHTAAVIFLLSVGA
ncbi:ankyrin, partial [Coniochaeta ligniaria NRRL 30616]